MKMNAPFHAHMASRYRSPRPFNNQSRPCAKNLHSGYNWRTQTNFGPINNFASEKNEEHWCETCDRGFPTADILEKHKQQHQKCNIDGCQFVAHPKVITKHIQMQHSTGLYKKISKLDNPEEIQKWREERKKKYPTRVNIEKKVAEYKEKVERGEKMALKHNRNKIDKPRDQHAVRKRTHNMNKNNFNHKNNKSKNIQPQNIASNKDEQPPKKIAKIIPLVPKEVGKNKLKPFTGILSISIDDESEEVGNILECNNSLIEEDEYTEDLVEKPIEPVKGQEPVFCGALTSLMCEYGSSDDEGDNNKPIDVPIAKQPEKKYQLLPKVETINNKHDMKTVNSKIKDDQDNVTTDVAKHSDEKNVNDDNSDNDSGPEEVKTIKTDKTEPPPVTTIPKPTKVPVNIKKNYNSKKDHINHNRYKPKVPSTLLQKLLHKEIRQERNIVLQCIRYIKKMNYFEKPG